MNAWSGGVVVGNKFVIWGGGHTDYHGNELATFDLDTQTWSLYTQPSPYNAATEGSPGTLPDGRPGSRHTYNSLCAYNNTHLVVLGDYGVADTGTSFGDNVWMIDMFSGTPTWEQKTDLTGAGSLITGFTMYNRVTNMTYYHKEGSQRLQSYDPATDTHSFLAFFTSGNYATAAMDTTRNRSLVIGGASDLGQVIDFTTPTPTFRNLTSDGTWPAGTPGRDVIADTYSQAGIDYDPVNDMYLAWDGAGKTYYTINADTFEVTEVTPVGGATPGADSGTGTYGRLRYYPGDGYFYLVNSVDQNFFRVTLGGGAPAANEYGGTTDIVLNTASTWAGGAAPPIDPDSDWIARSTAPGVTLATRFDTEAEVLDYVLPNSTADHVTWTTDPLQRKSGNGAMKFDLLATDTTGHGDWRRFYVDGDTTADYSASELGVGDEVYVSWRQYFPNYLATHAWEQTDGSTTGFKQAILSTWSNSNTAFEVVMTSISEGMPTMYRQGVENPGEGPQSAASWDPEVSTSINPFDFKRQNYIDRSVRPRDGEPWPMTGNNPDTGAPWTQADQDRARYGGLRSYTANLGGAKGPADPLTGAITYPQDGVGAWMSFMIRVQVNSDYGSDSTNAANFNSIAQSWAAKDGEDWTQFGDLQSFHVAAKNVGSTGLVEGFTAFWLHPYTSSGAASGGGVGGYTREDTYTLYDEVIVSTLPIKAPQNQVTIDYIGITDLVVDTATTTSGGVTPVTYTGITDVSLTTATVAAFGAMVGGDYTGIADIAINTATTASFLGDNTPMADPQNISALFTETYR